MLHTPTLPQHGKDFSHEKLRELGIKDYADAINKYIDDKDLDNGSLTIIGHSMGGLIGQLIASKRQLESLILMNSVAPAGVNHFYPSSLRSALHIFRQLDFWRQTNRPPYKIARYGLFNELDEAAAQEAYQGLVYDSGRAFAEMVFWSFNRKGGIEIDPDQVSGRKLILSSGRDHIVNPRVAQKLAGLYPNADFRLFPNSGHWMFGERNDELIFQGIVDWLVGVSKPHHQPARAISPASETKEGTSKSIELSS